MKHSLFACLFTTVVGGVAYAQPAEPPQPVMPNVLSTARGGLLDARFDYTNIENSDATLLAFDVNFQYVSPRGFGGYVALPITHFSIDDGIFEASETSVGNLELGGLYVNRNSPTLDFYGRVGIALDTADDELLFGSQLARLVPRPVDAIVSGGGTSWLRLGGGLRTRGEVSFGGQINLDYPSDGDIGIDAVLSLAGSITLSQPAFNVSGGLVYLAVSDDSDNNDEDTVGLNATIDFPVGQRSRLYGALGLNLDDIADDLGFSLGLGIRAAL